MAEHSLITKSANITNSYVAEGSIVKGNVKNSIIFTGCVIDEFAEISDSVVMPNTHIGSNASVKYSIIGENVTVEKKCKIGGNPDDYQQWDISVVGKDNILDIEQVVKPGEII